LDLERWFSRLPARFLPEQAKDLIAIVQFEIQGQGGGNWYVTIVEQQCNVSRGKADSPTVTIAASAADWRQIASGLLTPQQAYLEGRIRVQGQPLIAQRLGGLFDWSAGRRPRQMTATPAQIQLARTAHDPYGTPRPAPGAENVPLRTSVYFQLAIPQPAPGDFVDLDSLAITLTREGGPAQEVLRPGREFAAGFSGEMHAGGGQRGPTAWVYFQPERPFEEKTRYTVSVATPSAPGANAGQEIGSWSFTTEGPAGPVPVELRLDLEAKPVRWHGAFFSGFCKPSFCTSRPGRIEGYELMDEVFRRYPKAFGLQRDFWLTGGQLSDRRGMMDSLPHLVREQETRRITRLEDREDGTLLLLEDFFGHEQYGIPSNRPLSGDYHPGDVVLVADGSQSCQAEVKRVSDRERTVLLSRLEQPAESWKVDYPEPLPEQENPNAPGLFPGGGCYLRKFRPPGTPRYYWGRVDTEWDLAHLTYGRRLQVNFCDAPGDLSRDGRNWTAPKDYAELHEVVRTITDRLIKRYGKASTGFYWSIFNEPDLGSAFWRADWKDLQTYYDYAVDAILRAFEDNRCDSRKIIVGGLELGAIFGPRGLQVHEFLTHCSPTAKAEGPAKDALLPNAAYADPRLKGKRSRRVEELCRKNAGRGSPCEFISIHAYNGATNMAEKLIAAKRIALEIDPAYYAKLWVNSHECCPNWAPPPDPAVGDSYSGNGYFPTWTADVVRRQLHQASLDPRFSFGETIMTLWPWPDGNLRGGIQAYTCVVGEDSDGDGKPDRSVTLKKSIFNFIELLASMGDDYLVLPELKQGGHVVSGFATHNPQEARVLLYSHNEQDTQARSGQDFRVKLEMSNLPWKEVVVRQYRIDRDHNTYFRLRERMGQRPSYSPAEIEELRAAAELHETAPPARLRPESQAISLDLELAGNGVNFLVMEPGRG
jgi:putative sterol carrier protein